MIRSEKRVPKLTCNTWYKTSNTGTRKNTHNTKNSRTTKTNVDQSQYVWEKSTFISANEI